MNGIDPKWVFYLGILVTIQSAIGQGAVKLTNVVPDAWVPYIIGWCTLLAFVGNVVMTALAGYSSKTAGPLVKPVVILAIVLGSLFAFPGDASAQIRKPLTGNIVNDIAAATGNPKPFTGAPVTDAQNFFNAKLLPDLQYAQKLALAAKNSITGDCYQAWIDIITTQQTAVKNPDGTDIAMPDPHIITEFEKLVELRNALQPESAFMVKCSPVASMVKKDIVGFIGIVISGGAGLATLVPGL